MTAFRRFIYGRALISTEVTGERYGWAVRKFEKVSLSQFRSFYIIWFKFIYVVFNVQCIRSHLHLKTKPEEKLFFFAIKQTQTTKNKKQNKLYNIYSSRQNICHYQKNIYILTYSIFPQLNLYTYCILFTLLRTQLKGNKVITKITLPVEISIKIRFFSCPNKVKFFLQLRKMHVSKSLVCSIIVQ